MVHSTMFSVDGNDVYVNGVNVSAAKRATERMRESLYLYRGKEKIKQEKKIADRVAKGW